MVDILMATYNGSKFIKEQINSIINQTYKDWVLYIRDDGSKDDTVEIIKEYEKNYRGKIIVVKDEKSGLGAKLNFAELLKYSKSQYCMFCDQDDVWLEDKIQLSLDKMKESEAKYGVDKPLLIHTDLKVVDGNLDIIDESFWKYQNLDANLTSLRSLLVQNNITGCTMFMNKTLVDLSKNIPSDCIMHDWWIGLLASAFGHIDIVNKQTMLYRQHGRNEVGAHNYHSVGFITSKLKNIEKINKSINNGIIQAKAFYEMYRDGLSEFDRKVVMEFSTLKDKSLVKRKMSVINNKFYKSGAIRTISYILFV
jgi:glycosyltransferase involved in cell wall biosynthesis